MQARKERLKGRLEKRKERDYNEKKHEESK